MNILSIDIDYAYSPSIAEYDDHIAGSKMSLDDQRSMLAKLGLTEPQVNEEKLSLLADVIREKTSLDTTVIIAEHHHEILKYLPSSQAFSIFNFDHHHDIYYPGWHSLDKLDEGNWVYFLKDTKILKYTWIRNRDSEDIPENFNINFDIDEAYLPNVEDLPEFDLVFACTSTHWSGSSGRKNLFKVLGANL